MLFRSSLLLTVLFPCLTGFETQIHSALRHFDTLRTDEIKHSSIDPSRRRMEVSILGRNFSLHLSNDNNLLAPNFRAVVSDETGSSQVFENINRKEFYIGEEEDGSSVSAHIDSEQLVTATILSHDDAYYIEPSHRHIAEPHDFHMIAYRRSDVVRNYGERHDNGSFSGRFCGVDSEKHHVIHNNDFSHSWSRLRRAVPARHTCPIALVADHKFYQTLGGQSFSGTINFMINLIGDINQIYRETNFDGIDGVGLQVALAVVNATANSGSTHFNSNGKDGKGFSASQLLTAFSSTLEWQSYCLAHLFTHRDFDKGVLGLAYVASPSRSAPGGICSPVYRRTQSLRTGMTTTINYGRRLVKEEITVVASHEIGHNWGSPHDPDSGDCAGNSNNGRFIMYPSASDGLDPNNRLFSSCSRRSIGAVLASKSSTCFDDTSNAFCGNFRVDVSDNYVEQCDEGIVNEAERSPNDTRCCDNMCRLLTSIRANCSDKNDVCCTNCGIADTGKRCRSADHVNCIREEFCDGVSPKCPESRLEPDGTPCINGGTCMNGKCEDFCTARGFNPCDCYQNPKFSTYSCQLCCGVRDGECQPYIPTSAEVENTTLNLALNGSFASYPNGKTCNNQTGLCDMGVCVRTVQDTQDRFWDIFGDFSLDLIAEWFRNNIVADVLIFTTLVWIPLSLVVTHFDRKRLGEFDRQEQEWLDATDRRRRAMEKREAEKQRNWAFKPRNSKSRKYRTDENVSLLQSTEQKSGFQLRSFDGFPTNALFLTDLD